ncbi:MAG: CBS domain-containing protein [Nitrososphaerota archaeon]|nr:CBS domain-containing protein [Nitrososphaerota archaeon]
MTRAAQLGRHKPFVQPQAITKYLDAEIGRLFPNIMSVPRIVASGESPLISVGTTLHVSDAQLLPVETKPLKIDRKTGVEMYGAVGGFGVLEKIMNTSVKHRDKLLLTPCKEAISWIGSVGLNDTLNTLLDVFETTRFGSARVYKENVHTLIGLDDVLSLYRENKIYCDMTASEVGSRIVSIPPSYTLSKTIALMFERRIRRVFVGGRGGRYISDRLILSFLFTPERIGIAGRRPEDWLKATISEIGAKTAIKIKDKTSVSRAASLIGTESDDCLISDNGKVISRWDLVMKPYAQHRLGVS